MSGYRPSRHEHERGAPLVADCDNWCRSKFESYLRNLQDELKRLRGQLEKLGWHEYQVLIAVLKKALEPLAEQDCESWGCEHRFEDREGPCEPKNARDALAAISAPKSGENGNLRPFVLAILEHFGPEQGMELDCCDFQELATLHKVIRWEKYDPERHGEGHDMEPGDEIWLPNVSTVKEDVCGPNSKDPGHWNCKCREGIRS